MSPLPSFNHIPTTHCIAMANSLLLTELKLPNLFCLLWKVSTASTHIALLFIGLLLEPKLKPLLAKLFLSAANVWIIHSSKLKIDLWTGSILWRFSNWIYVKKKHSFVLQYFIYIQDPRRYILRMSKFKPQLLMLMLTTCLFTHTRCHWVHVSWHAMRDWVPSETRGRGHLTRHTALMSLSHTCPV